MPPIDGCGLYRNKWESEFAHVLNCMVIEDKVNQWWYEPVRVILGKRCTFMPDFLALMKDMRPTFYEVKGFWREDARVKMKVAASKHKWARWVAATKKNGIWVYETF